MRVPYHIGSDNSYSLAFVGADEDAIQRWKETESTWNPRYFDAPGGRLALAYTESRTDGGDDAPELSDWSNGTGTIAYAYLSAYRGVVSQADVRENKTFDGDKVERALERVEWRQTVPEVAGELWSNLVLAHSLPNGNHRSALAVTSLYLQSVDSRATLGTHVSESPKVEAQVNAFFASSKRILTVRRNARKFDILASHGVTEVERKGGIIIRLSDYDLGVGNPYKAFAREHRAEAVSFIERYLQDLGLDNLVEEPDTGKNSFVQALQRE